MATDKPSSERIAKELVPAPIYLPTTEQHARSILLQDGARAGFGAYWDRAHCESSDAQAVIAMMFLNGWVDNRQLLDEAEFWARKSAIAGNQYGQWVSGWVHMEKTLWSDAVDYFLLAAQNSFSPAFYVLGTFCLNGVIVNRQPSIGIELIRSGADLGHRACVGLLVTLMRQGHFGPSGFLKSIFFDALMFRLRMALDRIQLKHSTAEQLVYARSIAVENGILRESTGQSISKEFEQKIADMFPNLRK